MTWRAASKLPGLAAADVTYQEVGATRSDRLPAGYGHVYRDVRIGMGRLAFEDAAEGLFGWGMHRKAGFTVDSTAERAAGGVTVILRAGWGPVGLTIPCRVVYTIDENDRRGFAYGTLPGHPERGEEMFVVDMKSTEDVFLCIRAFSRPASLLARCGGPLTRIVQERVTDRYVHAIESLCQPVTDN